MGSPEARSVSVAISTFVRETDLRRAERDLDVRRAFERAVGLDLIVVTPHKYAHVLPTTAFGQTILAESVIIFAA